MVTAVGLRDTAGMIERAVVLLNPPVYYFYPEVEVFAEISPGACEH